MGSVVERMFRHPSGVSQFGHGREKGISHRYDGRTPDRLFQAVTSGLGPAGDQCTVAKLADGHCGDEYLVPGHELDVWLQASAASFAERGAEDAGVYDDPHEPSAAANASSSSSSRSSMSRASMETITRAARSCSSVRSPGSRASPWGTSSAWCAALLTAQSLHRRSTVVPGRASTRPGEQEPAFQRGRAPRKRRRRQRRSTGDEPEASRAPRLSPDSRTTRPCRKHDYTTPATWQTSGVPLRRIVFVHGGAVDHTAFQGVISCLDKRLDMVAEHRPSVPQLTHAIGADTALVGASFGGGLALEAACRSSTTPRRVVVIGPFLPNAPHPGDQARTETLMAAARRGPETFADAALADDWFAVGVPIEQRAQLRSMLTANAPLQPGRQPLEPPVVSQDDLDNLEVPVIVLVGELDDPVNKANCQWLAETLPRGELREVPRVGHLVELAAPRVVAEAITSEH